MERRDGPRPIVIVGGGPAGLVTAIAALHAAPSLCGRVVVLERHRHPRAKPCAGALGGRGRRALERLGAMPRVASVRVSGLSVTLGRSRLDADLARPIGEVVDRAEFDHALARIAVARGADLREDTRVLRVDVSGASPRVHTSRGTLTADLVVGADGVGSTVRRALGVPESTLRAQVLEVDTPRVSADGAPSRLHFDLSDRALAGYAWDFPTLVDGELRACRGVYALRLPGQRTDLDARLDEHLARLGLRRAAGEAVRYAERGYVVAPRLAVGRVMLVGEAAGVDPVTGEGIAQAIEYGAMAGAFVAEAVTRGSPIAHWGAVVGSSRLGRDLRMRGLAARALYGRPRDLVERWLLSSRRFLELGAHHFAGEPKAGLAVARSVAGASVIAAGWALRAVGARP